MAEEKGNITPIFKKGKKEHPGNFSQVSLLEAVKAYGRQDVIRDSKDGFTKAKLCLTNLLVCYSGVTVLMDNGKATVVIHLDECKAIDMVSQNVLISKLERYGFDRWTV